MNLLSILCGILLLASLPASTNYKLDSFGFGSGGVGNASSTNYRANAVAGEQAGSGSSTNYKAGAGEAYLKQAQVPLATISNGNNWYDKLKLVITPNGNPTDTLFAVAISSDNFVTTQYVKSDFTVGSTLTMADRLTYTGWGGASGVMVRGLNRSTVYTVKATAFHGAFTESQWGPTTSASTVDPQISFDIDIAPTDTSTSPPYQIDFGNLIAGSVNTATDKMWVSIDTNADNGVYIYNSGKYAGLKSPTSGHVIPSMIADLTGQTEGWGEQDSTATQTSGGPLSKTGNYNVSGNNVGIVPLHFQEIFSAPAPITGGRGSVLMKAITDTLTPAGSDYTETLTVVAAGSF